MKLKLGGSVTGIDRVSCYAYLGDLTFEGLSVIGVRDISQKIDFVL